MNHEELVKEAFKAMDNAYAPYSNYHVGACVLCKDGRTFYGANIENASYGATNCGERSAVFAAYSYGYKVVTLESSFHYYHSARPGDILTAEANVLHKGQTTAVFDVKITDQRGTLLGSGTFAYYLLSETFDLN